MLARREEGSLRRDLEQVRASLSQFGDSAIETVGALPSYICSRIGVPQHFTFLEECGAIPFYFPALTFGEGAISPATQSVRTLHLHRMDGSLHRYEQFDRRFLAYNALICGKTGSGKSVLANALSSALMQDPTARMIKIDVGGSYKKE
jgi:Cdc6-like AAA superfamily ATPase